jgi:hypothetical protein
VVVGTDQAGGLLLFLEDGGGDLVVVVLLAARVTGMMLAPCRQRWRWQTWRHRENAHRRRAGWGLGYLLAQIDLLLALGVVRLGRHDGGCVIGGVEVMYWTRVECEVIRSAAVGRRR